MVKCILLSDLFGSLVVTIVEIIANAVLSLKVIDIFKYKLMRTLHFQTLHTDVIYFACMPSSSLYFQKISLHKQAPYHCIH